jgi:hypothetical protein
LTPKDNLAVWRRYTEKGGRVYVAQFIALADGYDQIHKTVQTMLDTFAVTGEAPAPTMATGVAAKKAGEFDVQTDADAERDGAVKRAAAFLAEGRAPLAKLLPKPLDTSRPAAWIYQNGSRYEDRAKLTHDKAPEHAAYDPEARCVLVSLVADKMDDFPEPLYAAAAGQYVWQYFGGTPPVWLYWGLQEYGRQMALGGNKGKIGNEWESKVKAAAAAGKRRLDQWIDVQDARDVPEKSPGLELFAWQWYLRNGRGAKKYKKQLDAYVATLQSTGDPAAARKAWEGVDFEAMQKDFKDYWAEFK